MHRKHPLVRRSTFFAFLFIGLTLILKPHHAALSQTDGNLSAALADPLQIAVKDAIVTMKGTHPEDAISLFDVQSLETGTATWAAGSAMVYAVGDSEESSPYLFPFVAYWDQSQWQVAVEYAPNYAELLKAAPPAILSPVHLAGLATPGLAMPSQTLDAPQLGLPWALGETQYLTGGPHSDAAFKRQRPWSAIDFAGGSYHVRAAADGVVYLMPGCPYVQINHGNGWQTGYYHLTQIAVKNGQTITRGTLLGRQSLAATCGGQATGTHMHMTLRLNGQFQNWHGQAIGGWRIEEGASPYDGCLLRAGLKRCAITAIYNDGAIGEGDGTVPALPATPTHTPRPTSSPLPRTPTPRPTLRSTAVARTPIPRASQTPGIIVTPATPNPFDLATLPETDGVCGLTTIRLNAKIPDNTPKLSCFSIPITATGVISELAVAVAMSHTWVSDLRMQLRGPSGQILTLLNRPGWPTHAFGYGSNLSALYPITFTKRGAYDAEQMGSPDTRRVICHDDQQCEFAPNADQDKSVTTVDLEALTGSPSNGNWQVYERFGQGRYWDGCVDWA